MPFLPALGQSDFRKLREAGAGYVDKTGFIAELLSDPTEVLLFPRPRRFGKTLNLSTLNYFLGRRDEDVSHLFEGLAIWDVPAARAHFQKYPVIFVTFKDLKVDSYERTLEGIRGEMKTLFLGHRYLLEEGTLKPEEARDFEQILRAEATEDQLRRSLRDLCRFLERRHGQKAVILIDEYDTPIHSGYLHAFFDEVVQFFRNFLSAALKDNPCLFKGVLTGILRVSRENLFSGLNNVVAYSLLRKEYATAFGFTEAEVAGIFSGETPGRLDEARAWYDGYRFGGHVVYNPWSILSYVRTGELRPYWVNTSSNDLLYRLLAQRGLGLSRQSEALLRGETVEAAIEEDIVLRDIDRSSDALWNFLLFSGYLTPVGLREEQGELLASLAIPNREVGTVFRLLFRDWLQRGLPQRQHVEELARALLGGDARTLQALLDRLLLTVMSYQDPAGREPEKLYHGFILGLLVQLEGQYEVRSNRESGYGRADVLVRPREAGKPGAVLELKVMDRDETVDQTLAAAVAQVQERQYVAELTAAGASPVYAYAVVFDGKRAWVRRVEG